MTSGSPSSAPIPGLVSANTRAAAAAAHRRLRGRGEPGPAGPYWARLGVNGIRYGGDRIPPFFPRAGLEPSRLLLWASEFHRRACAAQPPGAARADIRSGVRAGPVRWDVGSALLGEAGTEAHEAGMRCDLPGDEGFALAEGGHAIEQARRDEREDVADEGEICERVHAHRRRLSHCASTFSCTFCGRWVETSR